jgi:hypothetical protein
LWPSTSEQSSTWHESSLRAFVLSFLSSLSLSLCSLPQATCTTILNGGSALKSHAPRPHNRNFPASAVPLSTQPRARPGATCSAAAPAGLQAREGASDNFRPVVGATASLTTGTVAASCRHCARLRTHHRKGLLNPHARRPRSRNRPAYAVPLANSTQAP